MIQPKRPVDDDARVQALRALDLLDTPREERYDRITRGLAEIFDVPICYLALIDAERQWLKSVVGELQCEIARDQSFCAHAILDQKPLIVEDAARDPRFAFNPLVVGEPYIRFYAGVPLMTDEGRAFGTLCLADSRPRALGPADLAALEEVAHQVEAKINAKPGIFISYSHGDEDWKDRLLGHLTVLQRQRLVAVWEDRQIGAGERWHDEIETAIEASNLAILLVSASFLGSPFVLDVEVPRLIRRRDQEGLRIVPLLIKPCCWDRVPWLAPLNIFPKNAQPLSAKSEHEIDDDLAVFSSHLLELLDQPPSTPTDRGPLPVDDSAATLRTPTIPAPPPASARRPEPPEAAGISPAHQPPMPRATARLLVRDASAPDQTPEARRFTQPMIVIGRDRACDLVLHDRKRQVSGRHAEIVAHGDGYAIVDLMSTNCTFLNDQELEPQTLAPLATGDKIGIGGFEIYFETLEPLEAPHSVERTRIDLAYVNLFEEPVRQLEALVEKLESTYRTVAPTRRDHALREAMHARFGGREKSELLRRLGALFGEL